MLYMSNRMGAWQLGNGPDSGQVEFKVFYPTLDGQHDPQITSIRVGGDFQSKLACRDWDLTNGFQLHPNRIPEGVVWSYRTTQDLPSGYYQYKYLVTFEDGTARIVSDPCTRYGGTSDQNAAFVIGGSQPKDNQVPPISGGRRHLRDLIVYELMIDDFTKGYIEDEAPLTAVIGKLDYIRDVGFNAILFMPWTARHSRDFDWGYAPFHFFAVEYRYANAWGKPAEKLSCLKRLVTECHQRGIHVLMDGVYNHVSPDFPYRDMYLDREKCPYTGPFGGGFPGLQDLAFANVCTREFILDVCLYWIDTFGIDGIRFDNTVNYYVDHDYRGIPELLREIRQHLAAQGQQNFSLTIEHLNQDATALTNRTEATSYWDNALYEQTFGSLWSDRVDPEFLNALTNQRYLDTPEKVPTIYLSNHDHSQVAWQAGARDNLGSMRWARLQPFIIALYTSPATPMVPNGQEFGDDHWLPEDDQGTGRRVTSRPLRWRLAGDRIGRALMALHKRMGQIRQQYPGLRSIHAAPCPWETWQTCFDPTGHGLDTTRQVAIYRRWGQDETGRLQQFVIVLNFSGIDQRVDVPFPEDGEWVDLLSGYRGDWHLTVVGRVLSFGVGAHWGHVFYK